MHIQLPTAYGIATNAGTAEEWENGIETNFIGIIYLLLCEWRDQSGK